MGLNLFTSDSLYQANEALITQLKKNREVGGNHIVIVPDRFTLSAETDLLKRLDIHGAFDINVTGFSRLAKKMLGDKTQKLLTAEGSVMLMSKAIIEVKEELEFYKKASNQRGFASELYAVITNIRNNCYTVDDLKAVVEELPEYLCKKTKDVIKVFEKYMEILGENRLDGSTLLSEFSKLIPESDEIADSDVYVFDFFSYTAEQRRILASLIKSAKSVNLAFLKAPEEYKNKRIYPSKEYQKLIALAKGVEVKELFFPTPFDSGRKRVASELFSYDEKEKKEGGEGIVLYCAEDVEDEIVNLARNIKYLIKHGYRYRDISVLSGDTKGCLATLKRVFNGHKIPYFADEKTVLESTPLLRLVTALINATSSIDVWEGEDISRNPLFSVSLEECEDFSNFVIKHSIGYLSDKPFNIGKAHPSYKGAESVRQKIINAIIKLEPMDSAENHVKKIRDFLENYDIEAKIVELGKKQEKIGDDYAKACSEQSYKKLLSILTQAEEVLSNTTLSKEEFIAIFESATSKMEISYIPMHVDTVYVGGAKDSRFAEGKVLFVMQAQSRVLPLERKREGILGDAEEKILKNHNVDLSPTAMEESFEEKIHTLELLIMPKEKLFLSYVNSEENRPSALIKDLIDLFSDLEERDHRSFWGEDLDQDEEKLNRALNYLTVDRATAEYAYAFSQKEEKIHKILAKTLQKEEKTDKIEVKNIENAKEIFFPYHTSISQIGKYFACPYQHYFDRALKVKRVETATSASLAGSFIHAVLEIGVRDWINSGYIAVSSKEFKDIVKSTITRVSAEEDFAPFLGDKYKTMGDRLKKEGENALFSVVERAQESDFKPVLLEYDFAQDEVFLEGEKIKIKLDGKIDRIDKFGDKTVLLDYKTGGYPDGATDLYYGKGVQLPIYMETLDQKGESTVGAFYYPLSEDYVKADQKAQRLKGNIDGEYLSSFDKTFTPTEGSKYLSVDVLKSGDIDAKSKQVVCKSKELESLKKYAKAVCERAVDEMSEGYIAPSPIKGACKYCDYKLLCERRRVKVREKRKVKNEDIVRIVFGEEQVDEMD